MFDSGLIAMASFDFSPSSVLSVGVVESVFETTVLTPSIHSMLPWHKVRGCVVGGMVECVHAQLHVMMRARDGTGPGERWAGANGLLSRGKLVHACVFQGVGRRGC